MRILSASRFVLGVLFLAVSGFVSAAETQSEWIYPGADGRLIYKMTPAGDRILDFSHAGYRGGGVALPDVPVKITVQPSGDADDTAAIQAAVNQVSAMPSRMVFAARCCWLRERLRVRTRLSCRLLESSCAGAEAVPVVRRSR
jgi:hypothetical protein